MYPNEESEMFFAFLFLLLGAGFGLKARTSEGISAISRKSYGHAKTYLMDIETRKSVRTVANPCGRARRKTYEDLYGYINIYNLFHLYKLC